MQQSSVIEYLCTHGTPRPHCHPKALLDHSCSRSVGGLLPCVSYEMSLCSTHVLANSTVFYAPGIISACAFTQCFCLLYLVEYTSVSPSFFPQDSPGVASHVPTHHSIAVLCMLSDPSKALVKNRGFLLIASVAFPSQPVCILCCLALNAKVDSKERIPVDSFRAVYLCLNSCGVLKKLHIVTLSISCRYKR